MIKICALSATRVHYHQNVTNTTDLAKKKTKKTKKSVVMKLSSTGFPNKSLSISDIIGSFGGFGRRTRGTNSKTFKATIDRAELEKTKKTVFMKPAKTFPISTANIGGFGGGGRGRNSVLTAKAMNDRDEQEKKKLTRKNEQKTEAFLSPAELKGENPLKDPMALIGIVGIIGIPAAILLFAFASGYIGGN